MKRKKKKSIIFNGIYLASQLTIDSDCVDKYLQDHKYKQK